jgi:lysophospholipase L1-like esterase
MSALSRRKKAAFSALLTLGLLLSAETALRLKGFRWQRSLSYMEFNYPTRHVIENIFEPDPVLLWRMRPGTVLGEGLPPLNAQGFRGADFVKDKPPGALRVACLGDSVAFGGEVAYPDVLAEALAEKLGRPVEVYNFGVPSYSSYQGLKLLPSVLETYQPDVVVILFGWNDHWLAKGFADKNQITKESAARPVLDFIRAFRVYQLGARTMAQGRQMLYQPEHRLVRRVDPADYLANLESMITLSQAAGALPILVTSPSAAVPDVLPGFFVELEFVEPAEPRKSVVSSHSEYNDQVRKAAQQERAPLADLEGSFHQRGPDSYYDDPTQDFIHPNRSGYELMARKLAETIASSLTGAKP